MTDITVTDERPDTFAGVLDIVVGFLDAGDAAYRALERVTGKPLPAALGEGRSVQEDLERLAAALTDRPDLDAEVFALMDGPSVPSTRLIAFGMSPNLIEVRGDEALEAYSHGVGVVRVNGVPLVKLVYGERGENYWGATCIGTVPGVTVTVHRVPVGGWEDCMPNPDIPYYSDYVEIVGLIESVQIRSDAEVVGS